MIDNKLMQQFLNIQTDYNFDYLIIQVEQILKNLNIDNQSYSTDILTLIKVNFVAHFYKIRTNNIKSEKYGSSEIEYNITLLNYQLSSSEYGLSVISLASKHDLSSLYKSKSRIRVF